VTYDFLFSYLRLFLMKKYESLSSISNDDVSENKGRRGRQEEGRGYFLILRASRVRSEGREVQFVAIV
jgi:hypothetical protein